ncbi:hypothetical protein HMPREF9099_00344 [Lachnospiraceae bacterium oral taxon 082 str. F0431]|jgi:hypothetical protein|nr:hypothetical protein HMPREF9099_00344 [Lachnospiraceae bacterium oral taxon 082 str. F0431]
MSNLKENSIVVPDVWTGKKLEKDIAEFKSGHSKEVEKLKRKVAELEYDLDSVERAFWIGVIGLTIFNLAVVAMFVF